jgi:peptidyl-tRNA hydrolase
MSDIPAWVQAVVALIAAFGGVGTFMQIIKAWQAWRDGIRQREDEAEERLVARLEKKIEVLEIQAKADSRYIRRLVMALGRAGIEIPEHPDDIQPS